MGLGVYLLATILDPNLPNQNTTSSRTSDWFRDGHVIQVTETSPIIINPETFFEQPERVGENWILPTGLKE
jgi:hypothetical protein